VMFGPRAEHRVVSMTLVKKPKVIIAPVTLYLRGRDGTHVCCFKHFC
jgi:hypothetical protein